MKRSRLGNFQLKHELIFWIIHNALVFRTVYSTFMLLKVNTY